MADTRLEPVVLSGDERRTLENWVRRRSTAQGLAQRARIVLACADGGNNVAVAARLRIDRKTVARWRTRFLQKRLDGLTDDPRPGVPRTITDAQVEDVVVCTLEEVPEGATHWSKRELAGKTGISPTSVQRIWRPFGLQPWRTETFKISPDPLLIDKIRDVVGLYLAPPANAAVLHFTPTYSSWINQVERWFAEIQRRCLDRGVFCSLEALTTALQEWIKLWNDSAHPFKWTKTPDQIIDAICRYCDRISRLTSPGGQPPGRP
jgi:transposase